MSNKKAKSEKSSGPHKTVPDELSIIINTNVPGFQTIRYNPSMTISNEKNKTIEFNPLVKLKQSVIDASPENIRKRQFADPGLFNSLIYSHGGRKVISLDDATKDGFVDNNINLTLSTLFPVKSIININKEPYTIANVTWKQNDWKINVKSKPVLDTARINDPVLYQTLMQEEMVRGEQQLATLTPDVAYGNKYEGPKNPLITEQPEVNQVEEKPLQKEKEKKVEEKEVEEGEEETEEEEDVEEEKEKEKEKEQPLQIEEKEQPLQIEDKEQPLQIEDKEKPLQIEDKEQPLQIEDKEQPLQIEDKEKEKPLEIEDKEQPLQIEDADKETPLDEMVEVPVFKYNKQMTQRLRTFFKNNYFLINAFYKNLDENFKKLIFENYLETTKVNVVEGAQNLSKTAYDKSVEGIQIVSNKGGGDCLFIAVADGINYHNATNPNDKIKFGNYGSGEFIFTQKILREITYNFIYKTFIENKTTDEINQYLDHANYYVDELNDAFKTQLNALKVKSINGDEEDEEDEDDDILTPEQYNNFVNDIYTSGANFLVTYDEGIPKEVDNYYKPFRLVRANEIKKYILSSTYWGDETAISAIEQILGLLVVPIETRQPRTRITRLSVSRNFFEGVNWSKYLFVLHTGAHYELLQFTFQRKTRGKKVLQVFVPIKLTIFSRYRDSNTNSKFTPPIFILFTIFGSEYLTLDQESKQSFGLLNNIFGELFITFNKIKNSTDPDEINGVNPAEFKTIFTEYFPFSYSRRFSETNFLTGGENNYDSKNYRNQYYKRPKVPLTNKTASETQICYIVNITMMLKKGTSITDKDISKLTCDLKWNAVNKSYATLMGKTYNMPPDYDNMPSTYKKSGGNKQYSIKKKVNRASKTRRTYRN